MSNIVGSGMFEWWRLPNWLAWLLFSLFFIVVFVIWMLVFAICRSCITGLDRIVNLMAGGKTADAESKARWLARRVMMTGVFMIGSNLIVPTVLYILCWGVPVGWWQWGWFVGISIVLIFLVAPFLGNHWDRLCKHMSDATEVIGSGDRFEVVANLLHKEATRLTIASWRSSTKDQ